MKAYKYRYGSKRDLDTLAADQLFAPNSSKLNDPCEAMLDINQLSISIENMTKLFKGNNGLKNSFEFFLESTKSLGIYSLSKISTDELLWAYYADSHSGFCIEYDLDKLLSTSSVNKYKFGDVKYESLVPKLNLSDISEPDLSEKICFIKSKRWQHEEEYRIAYDKSGKVSYDFTAIKAIFFGINMSEQLNDDLIKREKISQDCIMKALQGRGISYYQMKVNDNSYQLSYQKIKDKYPTDKKYKYEVKDLDRDLIAYGSLEKYNLPKETLDKVAEIIRRKPLYEELSYISVSTDESKKYDKPIIFAGYYSTNSIHQIKEYFTLEKINDEYSKIDDL